MAPNTGIMTDSLRLAVDMCDLHSNRWGITEILAFMCSINYFPTMCERQSTDVKSQMETGRSLTSSLIQPLPSIKQKQQSEMTAEVSPGTVRTEIRAKSIMRNPPSESEFSSLEISWLAFVFAHTGRQQALFIPLSLHFLITKSPRSIPFPASGASLKHPIVDEFNSHEQEEKVAMVDEV
ncbi:hypothetical protein Anapl_06703 [Anas platyrhynchos]|uniref:Uncharacterized protein n=1 Tax=Anas platyrhynchos TaxID=8839 RepID=R0LM50_ANAPL|nr:hypothetical protein Anapl_06703 [Anas platyrhynchos]